ncbi:unnamed protein product [Lactuca virosa]|uniref:C3H1-type domain-containing protein n=1 Tax=Lactuca virosa TaxID=75947 RepID=A0AAU9NH75_9ASTR|nr:unnamed protein product [Lactuca virosa]
MERNLEKFQFRWNAQKCWNSLTNSTLRECVQKLQLLKTPEERERRLREVPEVHTDPKMNPDYESDDTEEYFNNEHGEHQKPKFSWVTATNTISPQKRAEDQNQPKDMGTPNVEEDSIKSTETSEMEKDMMESNRSVESPKEANCNGSTIPESNPEPPVSSSLPTIVVPEFKIETPVRSSVPTIVVPESNIETPVRSSVPTIVVPEFKIETPMRSLVPTIVVPESKIETPVRSLLPTIAPESKIETPVSSSVPAIVVLESKIETPVRSSVPTIVSESKIETRVSSSLPTIEPESTHSSFLSMLEVPSPNDDMWHYRDPSGNVQGPFSMVQLQQWNIRGYFPNDMRVWAGREADSVLLNDVLQQQFNNPYNDPWSGNVASNEKVNNQIEEVNVPETSYAMDSVNLEKLPESDDNNYNLNCNPPNMPISSPSPSPSPSPKGLDTDINQHVSQVFPVADEALVDLQSQLLKKESHENEKDKQQSAQPSGNPNPNPNPTPNPPTWSTALSLVIGGAQLPETSDEWGRYPPKPEDWGSARVSVSPLKPLEVLDHQVGSTNMDQIMHHHSSPPQSSQPYHSLPAWHGLGVGETIEFATLAEESVSDLLAEVDAMESRNGVPSPTSRRNSFLEDLFNGSMDDFSPTDQDTDMHLHRQSHHFSFGLETKSIGAVAIPTTNSDHMGFKWAEMGGSELPPPPPPQPPPPRQDMIDLNDSTRAETDEGERDDLVEEKSRNGILPLPPPPPPPPLSPPPPPPESRGGRKSKGVVSGWPGERIKAVAARKFSGFPDVEEEEGEFIQPDAPPPPPPPQSQPPLLPLPLPLTMGFDVVDSRRMGSEKYTGRASQGATSGSRSSHSRSVNVGRESSSHHRRSSGGDRYNNSTSNSNSISKSISPRERTHHGEDSGHGRSSSRASWGRQSSFSSGGSGGGGAGGYSRAPPSKGQRICKFYESGRCKKGSSCSYLHQQER